MMEYSLTTTNSSSDKHFENVKSSVQIGATVLVITFSILTIVGSLLVAYTFVAFKELRTTSRKFFLFLCLTNSISSIGHIFTAGVYLSSISLRYRDALCQIPAILSVFADLCTFFWTVTLTVYLFLVIVKNKLTVHNKMIHAVNWITPGIVTILVLVFVFFVEDPFSRMHCSLEPIGAVNIRWGYLRKTGWEIATFFIIVPHFIITSVFIFKRRREIDSSIQSAAKKLLFVPVVFLLVYVWGTVRSILIIHGIINADTLIDRILLILQAGGDNSQGLLNAVVFCFGTRRIRARLFSSFWRNSSRTRSNRSISNFERRIEGDCDNSFELITLENFEVEPMLNLQKESN